MALPCPKVGRWRVNLAMQSYQVASKLHPDMTQASSANTFQREEEEEEKKEEGCRARCSFYLCFCCGCVCELWWNNMKTDTKAVQLGWPFLEKMSLVLRLQAF